MTEYIKDLKVLPMPWTTTGMKALIATGAVVPPPGPPGRPLGAIAAWAAAGAVLAGMALLGALWAP